MLPLVILPLLLWLLYKAKNNFWRPSVVRRAVEKRQQQVDENRAELQRILAEKSDNEKLWTFIVGLEFFELKDALRTGAVNAPDVLLAYQWAALAITQRHNCVTWFLLEATERAAQLHERYEHSHDDKPPLYGLPFSVKENFELTGHPISRGCGTVLLASESGTLPTRDASLVAHLVSLGAIPFVRTNVPVTMMSFTLANRLYGTTSNPHMPDRTPGGSSGGEACLIACGGSPFGLASDLAGSMRMPAHSTGICTLKPTADRLCVTGAAKAQIGCGRLKTSYGFMARQPAVVEHLMFHSLTADYWQRVPQTVPLPFAPEQNLGKLRIGVVRQMDWIPAHPALEIFCSIFFCSQRRALELAADVLECDHKHVLIDFEVPRIRDAVRLLHQCLLPDNGQFVIDSLSSEHELEPLMKPTYYGLMMPALVRRALAHVVRLFSPELAEIVAASLLSLAECVRVNDQVDHYRTEFFDALNRHRLDALLVPGFAFPAPQHHLAGRLMPAAIFTGLYNLLDMPAGSVPVSRVTEEDDAEFDRSTTDKDVLQRLLRQALLGSAGLPVGVQLVARPYAEEQCLALMQQLHSSVKHQVPTIDLADYLQ